MDANKLWKTNDISNWKKYYAAYDLVLKTSSERKNKKKMIALDNWYQDCLGEDIRNRKVPYIEKNELVKLMDWKLMRGKFRPRLPELINSNPEETVKKISERSFKIIAKPDAAIKELCQLRGVGPATASAILTAFSPEKYSFMADEAVKSVLPGKIDYTLKYYLEYLEKVKKRACEISKKDGNVWTPHDIERALWASYLFASYDLPLTGLEVTSKTMKRKTKNIEKNEGTVSKKRKLKK